MKRFEVNEDLIGKYVNQHLWTDAYPIGKIVGIHSKTMVLVQPVRAGENKTKMEMVVGGFAAHTTNNHAQSYDFEEVGEIRKVKLTNKSYNAGYRISDRPYKHYDYNF